MGKLITNPPKPVVRVKVSQSNYRSLAFLAQTVHDLMLANIATFPAPTPSSVTFQTNIDTLFAAIALIGTKFNKGSHSRLTDCKDAAFVVFNDLTERAAYVQNHLDANDNATFQAVTISQSGFAAKSKRSRIPALQFVRNVRQTNTKQFPHILRRINWRKSLGLFNGVKIAGYNIYAMNRIAEPGSITHIASTTKTNFIVPASAFFNGVSRPITEVVIRPVNASGEGNAFEIPVI